MMHKYVKKPVVIEAMQWTGDNTNDVLAFCPDCFTYEKSNKEVFVVATLEGSMHASLNDFIIKGIKDEFYACKPDVFVLTYDKVD